MSIGKRAFIQSIAPKAVSVSTPPPTGGLNTRDPKDAMSPNDAINLVNWLPQENDLISRRGFSEFATGITGTVQSIIEYIFAGTRQMLIGAGGTLYLAPESGGVVSVLSSGYNDSRWDSAKIGVNMILCNRSDSDQPLLYDGNTVTNPVYSGDILAVGANTMDGAHVHRNRMYMWDLDSSSFYYGITNGIQGNFTEFPLGNTSLTGGNIQIIQSISRDGGSGPEDLAAFILDTGEILIYQGSDPGDADNWSLVGRYLAPPVLSPRSAIKFAGDVLLLTQNDWIRLADAIKTSTDGQAINVNPTKLSGAISSDASKFQNNDGWQIAAYGKGGWIIINVPENGSGRHQYIINTITGAPTSFEGMNSNVWGVYKNNLFFGAGNIVYQADDGESDDGAEINLIAQSAFTDFGSPNNKRYNSYRILFSADSDVTFDIRPAINYGAFLTGSQVTSILSGPSWDEEFWDDPFWASSDVGREAIANLFGFGLSISVRTEISLRYQRIKWYKSVYGFQAAQNTS